MKGQGICRIALRRRQFEADDDGNPTMLIWLGKQYLGQPGGGTAAGGACPCSKAHPAMESNFLRKLRLTILIRTELYPLLRSGPHPGVRGTMASAGGNCRPRRASASDQVQ